VTAIGAVLRGEDSDEDTVAITGLSVTQIAGSLLPRGKELPPASGSNPEMIEGDG
jgi:hypothetical protein